MTYRSLSEKEIATLTVYGCSAEKWSNVQVAENFSPAYVSNVHFSGEIRLGTFSKVFELEGGVNKHAGIFNCLLHNTIIHNDVYINKINNHIANYEIGEGTFIENVNSIICDGESTFGNNTQVAVMVEAGGRELPIFDQLSAPLAYIYTFYKHDTKAIQAIEQQIKTYTNTQKSNKGTIGKNAKIINSDSLTNVRIGDFALVAGVLMLQNGTILSNEKAPVAIGKGVQCSNFIIQSGTQVTEAAIITNCFIGQGCLISKQFSAIDSVFFANCQGLHSEAVSIFAGPYTVTHHKATLMLTALYSFMNAGSATNFSNHMYKLGPVHQGITERGVKTSSGSYIMWPARIGAFTVVLGKHKGNPDLTNLPFSYLLENDGESNLLPGINLQSAGTIRDVEKWSKRDNRTDDSKLDDINFDFLSPITLGKAIKGIEVLQQLLAGMDETASFVWYQNCKIKRAAIKKGIELYEMSIYQYIGDKINIKIGTNKLESKADLATLFSSASKMGIGQWVDMVGLLAPKSEVDKLLAKISTEKLSLSEMQSALNSLHQNYDEYSWNWTLDVLEKTIQKPLNQIDIDDIDKILALSQKAKITFNDHILRDAKKEFNSISKTGFGIDGDETDKNLDFEAVRGTFEENAFVKGRRPLTFKGE